MRRFALAAVLALTTAALVSAQPDPSQPYTVVSRYSPSTGAYSNTEYFINAYTGLPAEQGSGYGPNPAVAWPLPAVYAPAPAGPGYYPAYATRPAYRYPYGNRFRPRW